MQVRILKGINEIGGCITEITSNNNTKIIIDFGKPLTDSINQNPQIEGLTIGKKGYDAVFITHSHPDHIGLIDYILKDIPIYIEPISKKIYDLQNAFTNPKKSLKTFDMSFKSKIIINNDIIITPYLVDHSAYNSAMLLIEADNKKVLHTGDFRSHGKKGSLFKQTLKTIKKVDLIITEATTLSRKDSEEFLKEEDLCNKATKIFSKYDQVFIMTSSTNIDRLTSFYKASKLTNKTFIEDLFTSNVVKILNNPHIPNPQTFNDVYAWIPTKYAHKSKSFKNKYITPIKPYCKAQAYLTNSYTFLLKSSMLSDLEKLYCHKHITNACLIYSMWEGYKEKPEIKDFLAKIKQYGLTTIINLHTSGHADSNTIKLLNNLHAKKVIPIHTTNGLALKNIVKNTYIPTLNETVVVE